MISLSFDTAVDSLRPFTLTDFDASLDKLIAEAKEELAQKVATQSDGESATWGFFPELNPNLAEYPACVALRVWFDREFLQLPPLRPFVLQLAFIRLATSEPRSSFGGLHIDASAGIDHVPPQGRDPASNTILRVLINLYNEPRQLQYASESIDDLRAVGADIHKDHYKIVRLPSIISLKKYDVQPRQSGAIHGIMFDSGKTLHAGKTNEQGHFLLSYGGYATEAAIGQLFAAG